MPIFIMTPNVSCIYSTEGKRKEHIAWNPYNFKQREFYLTDDEAEEI